MNYIIKYCLCIAAFFYTLGLYCQVENEQIIQTKIIAEKYIQKVLSDSIFVLYFRDSQVQISKNGHYNKEKCSGINYITHWFDVVENYDTIFNVNISVLKQEICNEWELQPQLEAIKYYFSNENIRFSKIKMDIENKYSFLGSLQSYSLVNVEHLKKSERCNLPIASNQKYIWKFNYMRRKSFYSLETHYKSSLFVNTIDLDWILIRTEIETHVNY